MVIYVDMLLIVNFVISYFLLLAASVLSGYTYMRYRIITASMTGAIFCLYIFVEGQNGFLDFTVKCLSLAVCSVIACGIADKRRLIIQMTCYLALNALLTGVIVLVSLRSANVYENNLFYYFNINPIVLVSASLIIYLIILIFETVKERISPQQIYVMDIFFKEFSICGITAFYDSGFKVKDIIANKDVVIVSIKKTEERLPSDVKENLYNFLRGKYPEVKNSFVPVFFNSLSGSGMIPAIKAEYIKVKQKKVENIVVAFTDNELSENVSALFGTDIKKQL